MTSGTLFLTIACPPRTSSRSADRKKKGLPTISRLDAPGQERGGENWAKTGSFGTLGLAPATKGLRVVSTGV